MVLQLMKLFVWHSFTLFTYVQCYMLSNLILQGLKKVFLKRTMLKLKTLLSLCCFSTICVSLAEAFIEKSFLSSVFSRDSIAEVSRDAHSESCRSILCKSRQKCASFDLIPTEQLIDSCYFCPVPGRQSCCLAVKTCPRSVKCCRGMGSF